MLIKIILIAVLFAPSVLFSIDSSKSRALQVMSLAASLAASLMVYFWNRSPKSSKITKALLFGIIALAVGALILYVIAVNQFTSRT